MRCRWLLAIACAAPSGVTAVMRGRSESDVLTGLIVVMEGEQRVFELLRQDRNAPAAAVERFCGAQSACTDAVVAHLRATGHLHADSLQQQDVAREDAVQDGVATEPSELGPFTGAWAPDTGQVCTNAQCMHACMHACMHVCMYVHKYVFIGQLNVGFWC